MTPERPTYVLDTGPLSHFARSQWLGILKLVLADGRVIVPDVVRQELEQGALRHGHLRDVLESEWIDTVALESAAQVSAFAHYSSLLAGLDGRNVGECGVLALAETVDGAIAVVDDGAAHRAAARRCVSVRRTLGLLCEAIRRDLLTVPLVSAVADDLLVSEYRLPFEPGGFAKWAAENGLA